MIYGFLNALARIGIIQHNFTGARFTACIQLPKHSGTGPVVAAANVIPVTKMLRHISAKQTAQIFYKMVTLVTGKAFFKYLFGNAGELLRFNHSLPLEWLFMLSPCKCRFARAGAGKHAVLLMKLPRCKMIGATDLTIAPPNMVCQVFTGMGVDVAAKTMCLATGGAPVAAFNGFVGF